MKQELPEVTSNLLFNRFRHEMYMISSILRNMLQLLMNVEKMGSSLLKIVFYTKFYILFSGGKGGKYSEYYDNGEDFLDVIEEEPEGSLSFFLY